MAAEEKTVRLIGTSRWFCSRRCEVTITSDSESLSSSAASTGCTPAEPSASAHSATLTAYGTSREASELIRTVMSFSKSLFCDRVGDAYKVDQRYLAVANRGISHDTLA